ncbi:MAG: sigma-70 family RNA polymerase sigma factor [Verrucomicrobiae bacterium]|nr:sigma-70 family RNA polymerase sigma factor [Verrucomicrobiae bacterium]
MIQTPGQTASFSPTRWTLVAQAAQAPTNAQQEAEQLEALEVLCRTYWPPLFVFVRRQGYAPEEAEDLVQDFFASILEKPFFESANPEKGRLRNYLLGSLKRFLIDQQRARSAKKRGGEFQMISVDAEAGEHSGAWQIASLETPEDAYQHRWVCAMLEHCHERLRSEYEEQNKSLQFEALSPLLTSENGHTTETAVRTLRSSPGAVRVALSRLRKRFGQIFAEEVRATLLPDEDYDDEICCLMKAVERKSH